jgi:hypothetical protein
VTVVPRSDTGHVGVTGVPESDIGHVGVTGVPESDTGHVGVSLLTKASDLTVKGRLIQRIRERGGAPPRSLPH